MQKITAYFVVFAWAPSTMSSSSLTSRHAKRCCSSFFCFLSTGQRERDGQSPNQNLEKFSSFELLNICTWEFWLSALKWFQIVPGKHRKRDVATVFAYSHLNTPIDQWECAYCRKYFISCSAIGCAFAHYQSLLKTGLLDNAIGKFSFHHGIWAISIYHASE